MINAIYIPHIDKQDNCLTITQIVICLTVSRCLKTFQSKETDYFGCEKILKVWGISGHLKKPNI